MSGKSPESRDTSNEVALPQGWPSEIKLPTHLEYMEVLAAEKSEAIHRDPETDPFAVAYIRAVRRHRRIIVNEQSPQTPEIDLQD